MKLGDTLKERKYLAVIAGAALTAAGALLVNRYLPDLLEVIEDPDPVAIQARYDPTLYENCGFAVRLPDSVDPRMEPPVLAPSDLFDWALENGGAPVYRTEARLLLEGRRASGVSITGVRAVVLDRSESLRGPEYAVLCEGEVAAVSIGVDLDEPNPVARTILSDVYDPTQLGTPYFSNNALSIALDEIVPISLRAISDQHAHWTLELQAVVDGDERILGLGGQTFVSAGTLSEPSAEWYLTAFDELRWYTLEDLCAEFPDALYRCNESYEEVAERLK